MARSRIEWTGEVWNPTTGCDRASPGCDGCYALAMAARLKAMGQPRYQNDGDPRTSGPGFKLTLHDDLVDRPRSWRRPRLVFVNSMSDLFHTDVPVEFIQRVFATMEACPQHVFQVLTKRSKRLAELAPQLPWPDNVWMGVSVESDTYTFRARHLAATPAKVKFVSAEPLLGPLPSLDVASIDWLIVGGESGPAARPLDGAWVRDLRDRCAGVTPFFFKQWGGRTPKENGRTLDGAIHDEFPAALPPHLRPERRTVRPHA